VQPEDVLPRLRGLGFSEDDAGTLADHFLDCERRGKRGHGLTRVEWLATLPDLDPTATPERTAADPGFEHWDGRGALGYLTLAAICRSLEEDPPSTARVIVARDCFPTGALGYWARWLAEAGLLALLTATSPPRLPPPGGWAPLVGTTPLAIGIPDPEGEPVVADVSMGRVTYGDVLAGRAAPDELVPFGGDQAHKAFALALGLQALVESCVVDGYGAFLVVVAPETASATVARAREAGIRLPGDGRRED
jgi:LDH2 family malate/lactate/ureidoglycolate dehydrogenase